MVKLEASKWIRTCQECGYRGYYKNPKNYNNEKWREIKCKNCKSESLDYGKQETLKDAE